MRSAHTKPLQDTNPLVVNHQLDNTQDSHDDSNGTSISNGGVIDNVLGKRGSNENTTSIRKLKTETLVDAEQMESDLDDEFDDDLTGDDGNKRERRLMQNRKSAKKCRLKKKAEFGVMRGEVTKLQEENKNLKEKINEITIMLYQKMEENSNLQRKMEQAQLQQVMFLSQMMQQNPSMATSVAAATGTSLPSPLNLNMNLSGMGLPGQNLLMPTTATNTSLGAAGAPAASLASFAGIHSGAFTQQLHHQSPFMGALNGGFSQNASLIQQLLNNNSNLQNQQQQQQPGIPMNAAKDGLLIHQQSASSIQGNRTLIGGSLPSFSQLIHNSPLLSGGAFKPPVSPQLSSSYGDYAATHHDTSASLMGSSTHQQANGHDHLLEVLKQQLTQSQHHHQMLANRKISSDIQDTPKSTLVQQVYAHSRTASSSVGVSPSITNTKVEGTSNQAFNKLSI